MHIFSLLIFAAKYLSYFSWHLFVCFLTFACKLLQPFQSSYSLFSSDDVCRLLRYADFIGCLHILLPQSDKDRYSSRHLPVTIVCVIVVLPSLSPSPREPPLPPKKKAIWELFIWQTFQQHSTFTLQTGKLFLFKSGHVLTLKSLCTPGRQQKATRYSQCNNSVLNWESWKLAKQIFSKCR